MTSERMRERAKSHREEASHWKQKMEAQNEGSLSRHDYHSKMVVCLSDAAALDALAGMVAEAYRCPTCDRLYVHGEFTITYYDDEEGLCPKCHVRLYAVARIPQVNVDGE